MSFRVQDHYFNKAKDQWFKARSAFKLEEIDEKYKIFDKNTLNVLDIWAAPGSRLQYIYRKLTKLRAKMFRVLWFDLKKIDLDLEWVKTYDLDIRDTQTVQAALDENNIEKFDVIVSDIAPNTLGFKDIDAMRSIVLLEETLRIYKKYLKPEWKIVIKIFMWPGFEEFVKTMKIEYLEQYQKQLHRIFLYYFHQERPVQFEYL
jgi:23S rRNA (uridine2552-2'-O)-methyltransferase